MSQTDVDFKISLSDGVCVHPEVLPCFELAPFQQLSATPPRRDAENAALEERADAAALNLVVRRLAYESYEARV